MSCNSVTKRLCVSIIKEHFGPTVGTVCQHLLSHGRSHLGNIIGKCHLSPKLVKESLFILLQHGLISFTETVEGSRAIVYYEAIPHRILIRNQFPHYISAAKALYGEEV
jgi:DNA-directed RNA polymerase III subunit RPC3